MRTHFAEKTVSFSKRMLLDNSHDFFDVSALLFHIVPSKSSKVFRIIYLKITGLKEMFSLQNGCAYPLGLCKMGVRAPMVSIFMFMFFSFSRKAVVEH